MVPYAPGPYGPKYPPTNPPGPPPGTTPENTSPRKRVVFSRPYWDPALTYEKSYLARLNYVHQNPVKHALVPVANQYRWCSAAWFERTATPAQVRTIYSFKIDRLSVHDEFDV
jgi:hypothetical protein